MAKNGFSAEALIGKLREVEVLSGQGRTIGEICKRFASRIRLAIGGADYGFSSAVPTGKTYTPAARRRIEPEHMRAPVTVVDEIKDFQSDLNTVTS